VTPDNLTPDSEHDELNRMLGSLPILKAPDAIEQGVLERIRDDDAAGEQELPGQLASLATLSAPEGLWQPQAQDADEKAPVSVYRPSRFGRSFRRSRKPQRRAAVPASRGAARVMPAASEPAVAYARPAPAGGGSRRPRRFRWPQLLVAAAACGATAIGAIIALQGTTNGETAVVAVGVPIVGGEPQTVGTGAALVIHKKPSDTAANPGTTGAAGTAPAPTVAFTATATTADGVSADSTCTLPNGTTAPTSAPAGGDGPYRVGSTKVTCVGAGQTAVLAVVVTESDSGLTWSLVLISAKPTVQGGSSQSGSSGQPGTSTGTTGGSTDQAPTNPSS
jgi:hypothetical protein